MGNARNIAFWVVLFLLVLALFNLFSGGQTTVVPAAAVLFGLRRRRWRPGRSRRSPSTARKCATRGADGARLRHRSCRPTREVTQPAARQAACPSRPSPQQQSGFTAFLLSLLPFLLLIGVWIYFMNRMQGGGRGGAMGFGKSRAKLLTEKHGRVTFDDVAGIDEAKEELEEIVEFLRNPQKFSRLGGKIPKGALLVGPPGTGKTLLARAIAGEAGVPFFTISGSDFVEMFVGVGA